MATEVGLGRGFSREKQRLSFEGIFTRPELSQNPHRFIGRNTAKLFLLTRLIKKFVWNGPLSEYNTPFGQSSVRKKGSSGVGDAEELCPI
jgi:hypothetical protein